MATQHLIPVTIHQGPAPGDPKGTFARRAQKPLWYRTDTISRVAMTLRLTEEEQDALRRRAALEGTSMQEAARRAVREYVARSDHRDRVAAAAELVMQRHAVALQRLGE